MDNLTLFERRKEREEKELEAWKAFLDSTQCEIAPSIGEALDAFQCDLASADFVQWFEKGIEIRKECPSNRIYAPLSSLLIDAAQRLGLSDDSAIRVSRAWLQRTIERHQHLACRTGPHPTILDYRDSMEEALRDGLNMVKERGAATAKDFLEFNIPKHALKSPLLIRSHPTEARDDKCAPSRSVGKKVDAQWGSKGLYTTGFVPVPNCFLELREALSLDAWQVLLVLHLVAYKRDSTECWPSVPTLARRIGCGASTIKRARKRLVDAGLLRVTYRFDGESGRNQSNLYDLSPLFEKMAELVNNTTQGTAPTED